jgi:hypothetical protein
LVDSLGLILAVHVHSAGIQDRDGAKPLLLLARWFGWLRVIWADGGYAGQLVAWVRELKLGRGADSKSFARSVPVSNSCPNAGWSSAPSLGSAVIVA